MYATQEQATAFLRNCQIQLPATPPVLHYEPTIDTGRTQGSCCVCLRPVAEYGMRWCGWAFNGAQLLVHAECYEATGNRPAQDPHLAALAERPNLGAYREQLRRVRTATLAAMAWEYEETTDPAELARWRWHHQEVQLELQARYETMADGGVPDVDRELGEAVRDLGQRLAAKTETT